MDKALELLKGYVRQFGTPAARKQADAIPHYDEWKVTKSSEGVPTERKYEWTQMGQADQRNRWRFMLDVDDPGAGEEQPPHVGWTADPIDEIPLSKLEPEKVNGHVWMDSVPVSRGGFDEEPGSTRYDNEWEREEEAQTGHEEEDLTAAKEASLASGANGRRADGKPPSRAPPPKEKESKYG